MKIKFTLSILTLIFVGPLQAEVFTHQYERNKSETIKMVTVDGMKVSESCFKNKNACWASFNKKPAPYKKTKLKGNPASIFCNGIKGVSLIFKDEKNNEYDFCKFQKDYYVDSWDLYERYNK